MSIEIERKFLVKTTDFTKEAFKKTRIRQGFLNSNKNRVVRIRIQDDIAFLTVKGKSFDNGLSRFEWETEIDIEEAEELIQLCEKKPIEKIRYLVKNGSHTFEIDQFLRENEGLVIAEIELNHKNESFSKPTWLGKEVTGIKKYYNSELSQRSYASWKKKISE